MNQKDLIFRLKNRLQRDLPGEKAHVKMLPPERRKALKFSGGGQSPRASSVLILLYPSGNYLETILIKRTKNLGVHSGQISFPGGKKDPEDLTPVHTALREAEEEIDIQSEGVEIIGSLSTLYVSPSNFEITPIIGYQENPGKLTPNPSEVEFIIELPLRNLETHRGNVDLTVRNFVLKKVPCFSINGHIVWGATAMILQELLDVMEV